MSSILIAGSSGFIGSALKKHFKNAGWRVVSLVRRDIHSKDEIFWDPEKQILNAVEIENFTVIINLAGTNIAGGLWTSARKEKILQSRILSTKLLSARINSLANPPDFFISTSAIGIYQQNLDKNQKQTEQATFGQGFLANVCQEWEEAAKLKTEIATKTIIMRLGVVLGRKGGLCRQLLPSYKLGLGAILGTGNQLLSWIRISDVVFAIHWLINNNLAGTYNFTSPKTISNKEFSLAFAKVLKRKVFLRVPRLMLLPLGKEFVDTFLLASQNVYPEKLLASGFSFTNSEIETALKEELRN